MTSRTAELVRPGGLWHAVRVVERTGSTNADLLARAAEGAPEGSVLVAEEQTAGRGRMGRAWASPPRATLTFSVLLRPSENRGPGAVPPARYGWIPLLAGVAVARAVREVTGLDARLKWPNDVIIGGRKLAGILAERSGGAVVLGAGINVNTTVAELPVPSATSLAVEGAHGADRHRLLIAVLGELEQWYLAWVGSVLPGDPDASGLREAYRRHCDTLGRPVRVELPGGAVLPGRALDVDGEGRLVLRTAEGERCVSAGDVAHLR